MAGVDTADLNKSRFIVKPADEDAGGKPPRFDSNTHSIPSLIKYDAGGKPPRFDSNRHTIPSPIIHASGDKVRRLTFSSLR